MPTITTKKPRKRSIEPTSPNIAVSADGESIHHVIPNASVPSPIDQLRELQAARKAAIRSQIRLINASGAFVRRALGWRMDHPEAERIKKQAAEIVKTIESGHYRADATSSSAASDVGQSIIDTQIVRAVAPFVFSLAQAREPIDQYRKGIEAAMSDLVRQCGTPAFWAWVDSVRGLGDMSVATIIGEAGDPAKYANPAKLWKRFGLAVCQGVAQGKQIPGMNAQDWIERGYSPTRRSVMFVIGDVLVKSNQDGPYRTAYLLRKAYEAERAPEMTKMHAHRRAQRYMEKMLLKDLWRAWNGHIGPDTQLTRAATPA